MPVTKTTHSQRPGVTERGWAAPGFGLQRDAPELPAALFPSAHACHRARKMLDYQKYLWGPPSRWFHFSLWEPTQILPLKSQVSCPSRVLFLTMRAEQKLHPNMRKFSLDEVEFRWFPKNDLSLLFRRTVGQEKLSFFGGEMVAMFLKPFFFPVFSLLFWEMAWQSSPYRGRCLIDCTWKNPIYPFSQDRIVPSDMLCIHYQMN